MKTETIYQTLYEFCMHPFGYPYDADIPRLQKEFREYKSSIKFGGYAELEGSYYLHVKIPSKSKPGMFYDVVLQFIPRSAKARLSSRLDDYVLQFFSNSPSFIYKYAALYKLHGYMIDALQDKLNPEHADTLPEKSNKELKLFVDKSIFFASQWVYSNNAIFLTKSSLKLQGKKSFRELISSISSPDDVMKTNAIEIEKKAVEEGKVDRDKIEKYVERRLRRAPLPKSAKNKISAAVRTTMTPDSMFKTHTNAKGKNQKKKAVRSTVKK